MRFLKKNLPKKSICFQKDINLKLLLKIPFLVACVIFPKIQFTVNFLEYLGYTWKVNIIKLSLHSAFNQTIM